ncbi:MAG: type IV secretion system protein VirB3 [Caulobacterales bacterium]|nr:type IV secretion system protein VirB3 [Caulobacterales bacterium]
MAAAEEPLIEETLFLACTRPAMVFGAPMEAVGLNIVVSATVFLAAGSPVWLLISPALHAVSVAVCKHDHNAFRVLWQYVETRGRSRNAAAWGGGSPTPLPLRRRFTLAEAVRG